jgi:hypothetical protein
METRTLRLEAAAQLVQGHAPLDLREHPPFTLGDGLHVHGETLAPHQQLRATPGQVHDRVALIAHLIDLLDPMDWID